MKTNTFLVAVLLLFQSMATAQKKINPTFTSINQVGVAWGATDNGLQLQTINGLSYKTFSAGLGIGLDYYLDRTIPVFIDIRKNIFFKKQTPFLYADLGTNLPWVGESKNNDWVKSEYQQGLYYDLGVGYKTPINKKYSATMSFGYTVKKFGETRRDRFANFDFAPYNHNNSENYDYILRRLSLKAGLSF